MTHTDQSVRVPGRVIDLDRARERHGEQADRMVRLLGVGDPLADAVILEIDALGKESRRALNAGLADGLASLTGPPPAIAAFLRQMETVPAWVDPEMIRRGETAALSVPLLWFELSAMATALVHTYSSPAIARLLVQTGRLTTMAPRRLAETGMWTAQATMPGGLLRGAPGYQATAQVRLLHARMRHSALKRGWDTAEWGVPINQVDVARTWLDFALISYQAIAALGFELTEAEQHDMYRYWHYIGYLLGLDDESFYRDITGHQAAAELMGLFDLTKHAPDENSRALTTAMIKAQVGSLAAHPQPLMSPADLTHLVHAILRSAYGDELSEQLGIPESTAMPFLALTRQANRDARRLQTADPTVAANALAQNVAIREAILKAASPAPTYQQHAHTGLPDD
ncbi:oxygenase MpaB family protein [Spongiactinospora rosea]|nr:oxygenase MpaB family protein [Spongiactinospora rosea]